MADFYKRINIAIELPEHIITKTIALSNKISKTHQAYFVLDNINFVPHITLYSPEYPLKNISKVFEKTGNVVKKLSHFTTQFNYARSHLGYIDITLEKTGELINLHEKIVKELNSLRENHIREKYLDSKNLTQYSKQQKQYIEKYGHSEVFDSFIPHITLTRLIDETIAQKVSNDLDFHFKKFPVTTIAAFEMGEHGTCIKQIMKWKLIAA